MPISSTRALVLGNSPLGEQDRLIHLLTENRGILRAIAPGSLKVKNRFGSLFELFTEGEFHYYWKETKDMITVSKGEIITSYFKTVADAKNIFYFYLIADICLKFIPYNHKDKRLYRLLRALLTECEQGAPIDILLLYFLVWVLRIEGMMFNPRYCSNCRDEKITQAWIRDDYRGLLCHNCKSTENQVLHAKELQYIDWTQRHAPKELLIWQDKIDLPKMIRMLTRKIQHHGECSLKSAQYLKEFR
jgi:DNA repair protein RecO (recombination protein O)